MSHPRSRARHVVRPRRMWSGVVVALCGAGLLALWTTTWHAAAGIAGTVLLVAGGGIALWGGVLYDTHGGRPVRAEVKDLQEARSHEGTAPGDMIADPRLRAHAAIASRRSEGVRRAAQRTGRPSLQPLGSWLLLIGAASLILAQSWYPHTHTGQANATRVLLIAVVVVLAALRMLLARPAGPIPAALAAGGGILLVVLALFTGHDRGRMMAFELVVGSWTVAAALLSLDRGREEGHIVVTVTPDSEDLTPVAWQRRPPPRTAAPPRPARTVLILVPTLLWLTHPTHTIALRPSSTPKRSTDRPASRQRPLPWARPLPLLMLLGLLIWVLARRRPRREQDVRRPVPERGPLRYRVPEGQDPAGVIAALRLAGYEVERDDRPTQIQNLEIAARPGIILDRTRVRATIEQAPIDLRGAPAPPHPVVFADEPNPAPPTIDG